MSQILQPGQHLDADQLSAFVEHALPEDERLASLAHLSECSHCRQVVFLAQQAEQEIAPLTRPATTWRRWFTSSPAFSVAAAALACALIVGISLRLHHESQTPVPTTTAFTDLPKPLTSTSSASETSITPSTSLPVPEMPRPRAKTMTPELKSMPPAPLFRTPQNATGGSIAGVGPLPQTPAPSPSLTTPIHGAIHDAASNAGSVNASSVPLSTREGTELQQQANSPQNDFVASTPSPLPATRTSSVGAMAGPISQPRTVNQTVEVTADSAQIQTEDANPHGSFTLRSTAQKAYRAPLPSNVPPAATASNGRQTLAVDSAGALFLSSDAGRHWTPVVQQWLGKAVQLSLVSPTSPRPAPTKQTATDLDTTSGQASGSQSSNSAGSGSAASLAMSSSFQLTTDLGGVWTSQDGVIWKPR